MTTDYIRASATVCAEAFAFLDSEFGYDAEPVRLRCHGFALRYRGPLLGVQVDWYPRDPLTVWLVRLADGGFPDRPVSILADTPLDYFDLGDVEAIGGHERTASDDELYAQPARRIAQPLAESLRTNAADLLRGDLTRIPLLEQRIRDRTRAYMLERFGPDAHHFGW